MQANEKSTHLSSKGKKGIEVFYGSTILSDDPSSVGSSLHSTLTNKTVGEKLLDSTVALRGIKGKLMGREFDISKAKSDYEDLRECKHLMIRCKEPTQVGWTAFGRQELGCQVWIRDQEHARFWGKGSQKMGEADGAKRDSGIISKSDSGIEVKCMSIIEGANCFEVFEYLKDHNERKALHARQSNTRLIKRVSFNRAMYHQRFKLHAPFKDREVYFEQYCCRLPNGR